MASRSLECEDFVAVLSFYDLMVHPCYEQIHDLKRVAAIFNKKNFLFHSLKAFSVIVPRSPFAQVLSNFSFQTKALSIPANPRHDDPDEPKPGEDGENDEQIEIFFRHCPCVSIRR